MVLWLTLVVTNRSWYRSPTARFNWVWQEATTFAPYAVETAHMPQLLASKGEERHIRGAANVLRSLTPNARSIFRLLAEHQLRSPENEVTGLSFHTFYGMCREQFFVSSQVTLRSHLTVGQRRAQTRPQIESTTRFSIFFIV